MRPFRHGPRSALLDKASQHPVGRLGPLSRHLERRLDQAPLVRSSFGSERPGLVVSQQIDGGHLKGCCQLREHSEAGEPQAALQPAHGIRLDPDGFGYLSLGVAPTLADSTDTPSQVGSELLSSGIHASFSRASLNKCRIRLSAWADLVSVFAGSEMNALHETTQLPTRILGILMLVCLLGACPQPYYGDDDDAGNGDVLMTFAFGNQSGYDFTGGSVTMTTPGETGVLTFGAVSDGESAADSSTIENVTYGETLSVWAEAIDTDGDCYYWPTREYEIGPTLDISIVFTFDHWLGGGCP